MTIAEIVLAALMVWTVRREIRGVRHPAPVPSAVDHVDQDGRTVTYPVAPGWTGLDILVTLSEIESLPVCAEVEAA